MVCSWIFRSVSSSIASSVKHLDRARDVWEDLRRRFAQCDAQKISALQNDIYNLKQGSLSVREYYTNCRTMWEEMNTLRPPPMCKCDPRCKCGLVEEIWKERDIDQVIRFLQGLNDDYHNLKSNVLVLDPLPDVYKVYVMAEKQERQNSLKGLNSLEIVHANSVQNVQTRNDETVAAVNTYNTRRYTNNGGNKAKCTFCGMTGHTIDKCYKKHGYPPGWVPGYKTKTRQQVAAPVTNNMSDLPLGVTNDQFQKLLMAIQGQMGQSSQTGQFATSSTAAATSLVPRFGEDNSEVPNSGTSWDDDWFS